jgi:hypothetical protein
MHGQVQQADLLMLPSDNGYHMALVVTDVGSRLTDAVPLKKKTSEVVKQAFETIYKRGILQLPKSRIEVDDGSEFKGAVKKFFEGKGVYVRVAQPGRSRQQAAVEAKNGLIARALFFKQYSQEMLSRLTSTEWTKQLPDVIKAMNETLIRKFNLDDVLKQREKGVGYENVLIPEGTEVRVALDKPREVFTTNEKLHGKFRMTDIRWNPEPTKITYINIEPNQPPMYGVERPKHVLFTRERLQIVEKDEELPPKSIIKHLKKT